MILEDFKELLNSHFLSCISLGNYNEAYAIWKMERGGKKINFVEYIIRENDAIEEEASFYHHYFSEIFSAAISTEEKIEKTKILIDFLDLNEKLPLFDQANILSLLTSPEYITILDYFISKGGDVNTYLSEGKTPLHLAIEHKNTYSIGFYIQKGASLFLSDDKGNIPFCVIKEDEELSLQFSEEQIYALRLGVINPQKGKWKGKEKLEEITSFINKIKSETIGNIAAHPHTAWVEKGKTKTTTHYL